jgi:uncharacterized membrane-anchored protein
MKRQAQSSVMLAIFLLFFFCLSPTAFHQIAGASDSTPPRQSAIGIEWQRGPLIADLGGVAQIAVPKGYAFTGKAGTQRFLELGHNPSSGQEVGLIVPVPTKQNEETLDWFLLFEFDETGYVTDSDRTALDADALLASIKKGTEEENKIRKQRGWPAYHVTGWSRTPFYDQNTHNLTWATWEHKKAAKRVKVSTIPFGYLAAAER